VSLREADPLSGIIESPSEVSAKERERALTTWLREKDSILIGFSGGVDSAYLACVALDVLGAGRMLAVIGRSASYPAEQYDGALSIARQFGLPVEQVSTDELNDPRYAANPSNRCYYCKTELWGRLGPMARERGLAVVVDGTNADDLRDHRPGRVAADESGVLSPLAILGFRKSEIRALSRLRGIPTWSAPSSPCLSSRIPYGVGVTPDRLRRVEIAERALRAAGVEGDLRVRYHGSIARIEISPAHLAKWSEEAGRGIIERAVMSAGFETVELDPRGYRSGSLNEGHITAAGLQTELTQLSVRRGK
jgi:pyridinium-3,5-biscarboxylic acid mononucleotide sulfurtransferase